MNPTNSSSSIATAPLPSGIPTSAVHPIPSLCVKSKVPCGITIGWNT